MAGLMGFAAGFQSGYGTVSRWQAQRKAQESAEQKQKWKRLLKRRELAALQKEQREEQNQQNIQAGMHLVDTQGWTPDAIRYLQAGGVPIAQMVEPEFHQSFGVIKGMLNGTAYEPEVQLQAVQKVFGPMADRMAGQDVRIVSGQITDADTARIGVEIPGEEGTEFLEVPLDSALKKIKGMDLLYNAISPQESDKIRGLVESYALSRGVELPEDSADYPSSVEEFRYAQTHPEYMAYLNQKNAGSGTNISLNLGLGNSQAPPVQPVGMQGDASLDSDAPEQLGQGVGAVNRVQSLVNSIWGGVTGQTPFKETDEARSNVQVFNQLVRTTLLSGRPSDADKKLVNQLLPNVDTYFQSPHQARQNLISLKQAMNRRIRILNEQIPKLPRNAAEEARTHAVKYQTILKVLGPVSASATGLSEDQMAEVRAAAGGS